MPRFVVCKIESNNHKISFHDLPQQENGKEWFAKITCTQWHTISTVTDNDGWFCTFFYCPAEDDLADSLFSKLKSFTDVSRHSIESKGQYIITYNSKDPQRGDRLPHIQPKIH